MYSRNITLSETRANTRGNRDSRLVGEGERIPVKSFVDSSAYEHFGNIGKKSSSETAVTNISRENQSASVIINDEPDEPTTDTNVSTPEKAPESAFTHNQDEAIEFGGKSNIPPKTEYIKPVISGLLNIIDTDVIILLAFAALLYFSEGGKKSKLPPIALIAIAFL